MWFRKARLIKQWTSNDKCGEICWSITLIVAKHVALIIRYSDLILDFFWHGNVIAYLLGTDSASGKFLIRHLQR